MSNRAVFLDRDGVINEVVERPGGVLGSPRGIEEFHYTVNIKKHIQMIKSLGYKCFVVTNQPDVSRNLLPMRVLSAMMSNMETYLDVPYKVCVHDTNDGCECRKPKPGMILELGYQYKINLSESWMVGDRLTDIEAGHSAGCRTVFLKNGRYSLNIHIFNDLFSKVDFVSSSMAETVDLIRHNS